MKKKLTLREIFTIAFPIMLGNLSMSLAGMADTIFMEKVGHVQMDAVGYCSLLLFIITILGWSTARGVQILTAQFDGGKHYEKVGEIFDITAITLSIVGVFCFIVFRFFAEPVLSILLHNPEMLRYSVEFTEIRAWTFLFINFTFVISAFYTGIGKTKILILSVATTAILNIGLNYVFVFGKYGMPKMGVAGSALATNISDFLSMLIFVVSLFFNKQYLAKYKLLRFANFSSELMKEVLIISAPLVLQHLFSLGAWVLFFTWIESIGTKELAVSMIVKSIYMFLCIPGFSLSTAVNTIVGNLVGKGDYDEIVPTIKKIMLVSVAIVLTYLLFSVVFIYEWIQFYTSDPQLIKMCLDPMLMAFAGILLFPFGNTTFQGVVSLGNTRKALYLEFLTILIYTTYMFLVIKVFRLNLTWAWSSELFYWFILFLFSFFYFKFSDWKAKLKPISDL